MGKKKKEEVTKAPEKKKGRPAIWIVAAAVIIIGGLAVSATIISCTKDTGPSFNLKGKETRPVLDPAMFTGRTRMAYAVAQKYPDLLNEVFCYCYCDQNPFHHKTLLSCFTDKHGAG